MEVDQAPIKLLFVLQLSGGGGGERGGGGGECRSRSTTTSLSDRCAATYAYEPLTATP